MLRTLLLFHTLGLFSTIFLASASCFSCSSEHRALLVIVGTAAAACCRPRRLILLEHNFNFCYVANTLPRIERSHTFFLPFLLLPSSRLLCRTHCSLPLLYLFLIRLLQRAPRTPSKLVNPSIGSSCTIRLEPLLLYSSRILTTNHGTHCIHAPRCSPYSFFQRTVRHLYT